MRLHQSEFHTLRTRILVISFRGGDQARNWLRETGSPFPLLIDSPKEVYRAYGVERAPVAKIKVLREYFRLLRAGHRLRMLQGDPYQLGGDFIVDTQGVVRLAYRSQDPADRPSMQELLEVLRSV